MSMSSPMLRGNTAGFQHSGIDIVVRIFLFHRPVTKLESRASTTHKRQTKEVFKRKLTSTIIVD